MSKFKKAALMLMAVIMCLSFFVAPGCSDKETVDIKAVLDKGYEQLESGDVSGAVRTFEELINKDSGLVDGWIALAETYWFSGSWETALEVLKKAMDYVKDTAALEELYGRIEASVEEAVEIEPPEDTQQEITPVKPENNGQEETIQEQEPEREEEQEPELTTELTLDTTYLESAMFGSHSDLVRDYGAAAAQYTELGWMVRYENFPMSCFYGYYNELVDAAGMPYDDSMPNMCAMVGANGIITGGETASLADMQLLFENAVLEDSVMGEGYYIACTYKGHYVTFSCDETGIVDLNKTYVEIYAGQ